MVWREHREVVVVSRRDGAGWDDCQRLAVHDQLVVVLRQQLLEPALSALRVRTPIAGDVDGTGVDFLGQRSNLSRGVAAADDQAVGAALLQRLIEVAQSVDEERRPVGRKVRRTEDRLVKDEHRQHLLGRVDRTLQGRVVVHAQVPGEQGDRRRRPHRAGCAHEGRA